MSWFHKMRGRAQAYEAHPLDHGTTIILGGAFWSWFISYKFAILQAVVPTPSDDSDMAAFMRALHGATREVDVHSDVFWEIPILIGILVLFYRFKQWRWSHWILVGLAGLNFGVSFLWLMMGLMLDDAMLAMAREYRPDAISASLGVEGTLSGIADLIAATAIGYGCWDFIIHRRGGVKETA